MNRRLCAVAPAALLAVFALAAAKGAVAQDRPIPPANVDQLTLDEALRLAEVNNPAHRRALNTRELTGIETREFWLGLLPRPQVSLLSTNMQWNRQSVGTDNFGNPIPNPDFRMIQSASSTQSVFLSFQLNAEDLFGRRTARLEGEVRELSAAESGQTLASDVRLAYLDAQERLQSEDLELTLLAMARENHQITEELFRLARVDRPDLLNAEIDLLAQEQELEESRADLRSALLRLRNVIGDSSLGEIEIEGAPIRVFDPSVLDAEALVQAAVTSGPRVRESELLLEQEESQRWVERSQWLPDVGLTASTGRQELSRESGSGFFQPVPDGEWSRRISLTLSFPDLGQYFNRQTTGRRTEIGIRNAEETLRETRFSVEEEVRGLLVQLANEHGTLQLEERRAELAQERLGFEQERYRLGLGGADYLTLQNAAETDAGAQRAALQARYAFERALIQLERSLGGSIEVPAAAVGGAAGAPGL